MRGLRMAKLWALPRRCVARLAPPVGVGASRLGRQAGATLVEFAVVAVLLFTIVTLVVQGGIIFNAWLVITNASREAARYGSPCVGRSVESCTLTDVEARAMSYAGYIANATVQATTGGGMLTVTMWTDVPVVGPLGGTIIPTPFILTASSEMRLEN